MNILIVILVELPTLKESYVRMASAGLTPFYRRPTLEKFGSAKGIREILVRVVKRRLIAEPRARVKGMSKRETRTCGCSCHEDEPSPPVSEPSETASLDTSSVPYQPEYLETREATPMKAFGQMIETEELDVAGWVSADAVGSPEVLLYIHGYNNSHREVRELLLGMFILITVLWVSLDASNSGTDGSLWELPQLHSTLRLLMASWKWILGIF